MEEWELRLKLEENALVKEQGEHGDHFKGFYEHEGYSDRPGLSLCRVDWREKERKQPESLP